MEYSYDLGNEKDWIEAGRITREALNYSRKVIENGVSIYDASEKIENFIRKQSGLAFPLNLSMNEYAAHDCADLNDNRVLEGVVKVDLGANVNGAIGDAAITIDLTDKHSELLEANQEALNRALEYVKSAEEVNVNEISKEVYTYAKSKDKGVVINLTGHGIKRNQIHTEPSIPAIPLNRNATIKKPFVFAIEPFFSATDTRVVEKGTAKIFQKVSNRPIRDYKARKILKYIDQFQGNPFASRWLLNEFDEDSIAFGLRRLVTNGNLIEYKPLMNANKNIISQFENTVTFTDKVVITTDKKEENTEQ